MKLYAERAGQTGVIWHLEMTRRNLTALLDKLADPGSARTLGKTSEDGGDYIFVKAVEDVDHYEDRAPGEVYSPGLHDLRDRLRKARTELGAMAENQSFRSEENRARLRGKVEGVGLALSYLEEYLR